jgi:hypothetical protein
VVGSVAIVRPLCIRILIHWFYQVLSYFKLSLFTSNMERRYIFQCRLTINLRTSQQFNDFQMSEYYSSKHTVLTIIILLLFANSKGWENHLGHTCSKRIKKTLNTILSYRTNTRGMCHLYLLSITLVRLFWKYKRKIFNLKSSQIQEIHLVIWRYCF